MFRFAGWSLETGAVLVVFDGTKLIGDSATVEKIGTSQAVFTPPPEEEEGTDVDAVREVREGEEGWGEVVFEVLGRLGFDVLPVQDDQAFALLLQEVAPSPQG